MRRNDRNSRRDFGPRNFNNRSNNFDRGSFHSAPREMHKTVCAECGQECEVPFKPREGRPVYCKECFAKHKPQRF